jgi:phosphoribosylamine--glycine ligase
VLDRLATPLAGLLNAAARGDLAAAGPLAWRPGAAVTVVIAAPGYPGSPAAGGVISGIDAARAVPGCYVLHAGTATGDSGQLVAAGGRVLNVVGTGPDLAAARARAYEATALISLPGGWYRRDIAAAPASGTRPPA